MGLSIISFPIVKISGGRKHTEHCRTAACFVVNVYFFPFGRKVFGDDPAHCGCHSNAEGFFGFCSIVTNKASRYTAVISGLALCRRNSGCAKWEDMKGSCCGGRERCCLSAIHIHNLSFHLFLYFSLKPQNTKGTKLQSSISLRSII